MSLPSRSRFFALVAALGLLASACGSGSPSPTTAAVAPESDPASPADPVSPADDGAPQAAASEAQENIDELESNNDVRLVEVLDVVSGGVTTLAEAVDGDRPVLLWFWAPH